MINCDSQEAHRSVSENPIETYNNPMNSMPAPKMTELTEPAFGTRSDDIINEVNYNRTGSNSSSTTSGSSDGDDFFNIDANDLGHPFSSGPVHSLPPLPPSARTDVPDPNRIPLSVFARTNTTNPNDWSVASNESLFSIQMGNSSFSRDHVFLMGRSGELTNFLGKSGELTNILGRSGNLTNFPSNGFPPISSPPVMTVPTPISPVPGSPVRQNLVLPVVAEANNEETSDEVQRVSVEGEHDSDKEYSGLNSTKNSLNYSGRISRLSNSSISSIQSFAFPILTGDGRNISAKTEPEHQQMKPQQMEQQPLNATENMNTTVEGKSWFSCFSCCQLSFPRT